MLTNLSFLKELYSFLTILSISVMTLAGSSKHLQAIAIKCTLYYFNFSFRFSYKLIRIFIQKHTISIYNMHVISSCIIEALMPKSQLSINVKNNYLWLSIFFILSVFLIKINRKCCHIRYNNDKRAARL